MKVKLFQWNKGVIITARFLNKGNHILFTSQETFSLASYLNQLCKPVEKKISLTSNHHHQCGGINIKLLQIVINDICYLTNIIVL